MFEFFSRLHRTEAASAGKNEVGQPHTKSKTIAEKLSHPAVKKAVVVAAGLASGASLYNDREEMGRLFLQNDTVAGAHRAVFLDAPERELADKLETQVGRDTVSRVEMLASVSTPAERKAKLDEKVALEVSGFDGFKISGDIMKSAAATLPFNFYSDSGTVHFVYNKEIKPMKKEYGIDLPEAAHAAGDTITFSHGLASGTYDSILNNTLPHEQAHFNDFLTNKLLTRAERLELLNQIVDRLSASDRYMSHYVESIHNPNADKQAELTGKAREYWAEIVAAYCSAEYARLPQADKDIVRGVLEKVNPGFKREEEMIKRQKLVQQAREERERRVQIASLD